MLYTAQRIYSELAEDTLNKIGHCRSRLGPHATSDRRTIWSMPVT